MNKQGQRSMKRAIKSSRPLAHFSNEGQKRPNKTFKVNFLRQKLSESFSFFSFKSINLVVHFFVTKSFL